MAAQSQPVPFVPPRPGISKRASPLSLGDRWIDGDKVQFVDGKPEKMPGWTKKTVNTVTDAIRSAFAWLTTEFIPFVALGTHRKLYVADYALDPIDITPIESDGTLTDPFTTTLLSTTVNVVHTAHGRNVGDEVRFDNASAVGGITIDGAYLVTAIVDDDNYEIEHTSAALGAATGGGSVDYEYELPIGTVDPILGDGYGAGGYGEGNYGEPTEDSAGGIIFEPRVWHLDNYGDLLIINPINGGIYVFDPDDTPAYQRAEVLANAPTVCRGIFVTPERFLFALGVDNDPLKIKWADQEDIEEWTPGPSTTANERRLREGSRIITGRGLSNFLSAVWTDTAVYRFQYTGLEAVYDSTCAGSNCGLVSPSAVVVVRGTAFWQSQNNFFMWNGGGAPQSIPNVEDVREYVARALRTGGYEYKCHAFYSPRYNTVMFLYVNTDDTEPGYYAMVSLTDFNWVVGTMTFTAATAFKLGDQRPLTAGPDGWLYQYEDGLDADGVLIQSYLKRAPMRILNGGQLGDIDGLSNDMQRQTGAMSYEIEIYEGLNEGVLESERQTFEPTDDLLDFRLGGRIAIITIRSEALGGDFRLGEPTLLVKSTGRRRG